jgi:hypothetical protein
MSAHERAGPDGGPFGNLSQVYCGNLDQVAKGFEPVLKNFGRLNLEAMGLFTRRAQAWFEVPSRAMQCKTPQDLAREQLLFWQTALRDYAEGAQRLTAVLGALAAPGLKLASGGNAAAQSRDYITFAEPKTPAADASKHDRRAA